MALQAVLPLICQLRLTACYLGEGIRFEFFDILKPHDRIVTTIRGGIKVWATRKMLGSTFLG